MGILESNSPSLFHIIIVVSGCEIGVSSPSLGRPVAKIGGTDKMADFKCVTKFLLGIFIETSLQ